MHMHMHMHMDMHSARTCATEKKSRPGATCVVPHGTRYTWHTRGWRSPQPHCGTAAGTLCT